MQISKLRISLIIEMEADALTKNKIRINAKYSIEGIYRIVILKNFSIKKFRKFFSSYLKIKIFRLYAGHSLQQFGTLAFFVDSY